MNIRMNIRIWEIGTLNQLFERGSYTEIEFSEKINSDKSAFFLIGPLCIYPFYFS